MPLYRDTNTQTITEYPVEIGEHPVLGRSLVPCDADGYEHESATTTVETPVSAEPIQGDAASTDVQEEN